MSLPNKINPADPSGSADPGTLDTIIQDFKTAVLDILGIASNTNVSAAALSITATGLQKAIFQNTAANPSAAGEVQRNSTSLKYYDGSAVQTLTTSDQSQTLTNKTLTAPIVTPTLEASLPAAGSEGKVIWLDDGPQGLVGDFGSAVAHLFGYNWIANAYSTLNAALAAISSTQATLVIGKSCSVTSNVTVPANVTLDFQGQGVLAIANGVTLTISGPIKAPRRQIFTYTGTGVAVFGNTNYQTWVYPEWTGAGVGVAAATNLDNINNAILLFPAGGSGTLDFAGGIYDIDDQILTAGRHLWFKGAGTYATILKQATASSLIHGIRVTGTSKFLRVTDLSINMAVALTADNGQKAITVDANNASHWTSTAGFVLDVHNVNSDGFNFGIYADGGVDQAVYLATIKQCNIRCTTIGSGGPVSNCVTTSNCLLAIVEGNILDSNTQGDHCIYCLQTSGLFIRSNRIANSISEAIKLTHFTGGAGNDATQLWSAVHNDIRNSNAACTMQSDSFDHALMQFEYNYCDTIGDGGSSNSAVTFVAGETTGASKIKKIAFGHNVMKDLQARAFYFSCGASSVINYVSGPDLHIVNWSIESAGTYRAIDADSSGTKRKAFFSGYFDGNSNGRSASGESGLISTFADVDVGPLYITGTTVAEANDKRTLMGSSTTAARMPAVATTLYTSTSTGADTTETDLQSYTLPANVLGTNGRAIRIRAWGDTAANGNTKTIRLKFGGTTLQANNTTAAPNGLDWVTEAYVVRISSGQQTYSSFMLMSTTPQDTTSTAISITDTASIIIKVTGQNGTANAGDITCRGMTVEVL